MAHQVKSQTTAKRGASKRVSKTGAKAKRGRAAAPVQRTTRASKKRGEKEPARKTATKAAPKRKPTARSSESKPLSAAKTVPRAKAQPIEHRAIVVPPPESEKHVQHASALQLYRERTHSKLEALWSDAVPRIVAQARALSAKGLGLVERVKSFSWQVTHPTARKQHRLRTA